MIRLKIRTRARSRLLRGLWAAIALVLSAPLAALAVPASERPLFWTSYDGVFRANLDGSDVLRIADTPGSYGIALDPARGKVYWTDFLANGRHVYRANLDGTNRQLVLTTPYTAADVALDAEGGKLYVTQWGATGLGEANLDGTDYRPVVATGSSQNGPGSVMFDPTGRVVYWTEGLGDRIARVDPANNSLSYVIPGGLGSPQQLFLDVTGRQMYWSEFLTNTIRRSNLDGTDLKTIAATPVYGSFDVRGLGVDLDNRKLYWSNWDAIGMMNLDGSDPHAIYHGSQNISEFEILAAVPEPSGLLAVGAAALLLLKRRAVRR